MASTTYTTTAAGTPKVSGQAGDWHFLGARHGYRMHRAGRTWQLTICEIDTVSDLRLLGQPTGQAFPAETYAIAEAVAVAHERLGEDYRIADHGGRNRLTVAVDRVYAADRPAAHRAPEPPAEKRTVLDDVPIARPVHDPDHGRCQICREVVDVLAYGSAALHYVGRRNRVCGGWNKPALALTGA
jgi:hypothetical protein